MNWVWLKYNRQADKFDIKNIDFLNQIIYCVSRVSTCR